MRLLLNSSLVILTPLLRVIQGVLYWLARLHSEFQTATSTRSPSFCLPHGRRCDKTPVEMRLMETITRRQFAFSVIGAAASRALAAQDLSGLSLAQASDLIRSRGASPTQLVEACLARIKTYNPKLNAFITVTRDLALSQARELEADLRAGKFRSPLHGIPVALTDNIDTAGVRPTAASAVFDDRIPGEDAEVTRRLREAGAIVI